MAMKFELVVRLNALVSWLSQHMKCHTSHYLLSNQASEPREAKEAAHSRIFFSESSFPPS